MAPFSPPAAKRVLVLSPHPDDESLGCSGTILLYTGGGTEVFLTVISKGEKLETGPANIAEIRRAETVAAAALLGIKKTTFLEFPDEEITANREEIKERLSSVIRDIEPDVIFAPSPLDPHPDHRATSEVALQLQAEFSGITLAFYEIYQPLRFNTPVDISSVIDMKKEAILAYRKSLLDVPELFWYAIKGLNTYRSLIFKREGLYEAFWVIPTPLSKNEIAKWATFDYVENPAEVFLSQIKVADALLFELQNAHRIMDSQGAEIGNLNRSLSEAEKRLLEKEMENRELRVHLDLFSDSLFWRLQNRFYTFRDKLMPIDTGRRNLYDKIITRLKKR